MQQILTYSDAMWDKGNGTKHWHLQIQVPVRYEYCLKTSEGIGPVSRKTSMIPLSDIQRTSVRDLTFCLAATGPIWVRVYWKRNGKKI